MKQKKEFDSESLGLRTLFVVQNPERVEQIEHVWQVDLFPSSGQRREIRTLLDPSEIAFSVHMLFMLNEYGLAGDFR
jgi:hypothetical protein